MQREIYASVLDEPAAVVGEVNYAAFTWEEEKVLGAGNWERGVCFFGAGGDFGADSTDEDLYWEEEGKMVSGIEENEGGVGGFLVVVQTKSEERILQLFPFEGKSWEMRLVFLYGICARNESKRGRGV